MMAFQGADELLWHGGDLSTAREMFPGAPGPFVDLSTGINPNPYPVPALPAGLYARLPDSTALARLVAAAVTAYGAPSVAHLVAAPGTQILLPLIASLVPPGRATVLAPTYVEHARAAALAGHAVTEVSDIGALGDAGLAILTNPNNPDGRVLAKDGLIAVARKLQARGGLLVIDEAFMDVGPADASFAGESLAGESLAGEVGLGNIVVLRSFGKFFGLAGLRLGFAIGAPALVERIKLLLGPWAVSGPALAIGRQALADRAWISATWDRLAQAANRLDTILTGAGLDIVGGTTLFRLARSHAAAELFHHLGRAGIFVRRFPDHAEWLRFGLPAAEPDWQRLQNAMSQNAMAAIADNG
ncbi:MAG: threonine-phosphate decarboxylase CobD [Xanthobacteraceae bacterium]